MYGKQEIKMAIKEFGGSQVTFNHSEVTQRRLNLNMVTWMGFSLLWIILREGGYYISVVVPFFDVYREEVYTQGMPYILGLSNSVLIGSNE